MRQLVHSVPAESVRRRRRSHAPTTKKSFTLHEDVVQACELAVREGEAPNLSAFVEAALEEKLRRTKRARLYEAYEAASRDAAFIRDMQEVNDAFDATSNDGMREA